MPGKSSKASSDAGSYYSREDEDASASEVSEEEDEEEEWTNDHLKLLYMISKFAECALTPDDDEGWIRKNSLLVLMYEGIVAGIFDYDYAPMSLLVGRKRVWLNISQEGKDDIDDLREGGLLNGLKLSSEDLQPITAYQVSMKGKDSRRRDCKELSVLVPREFRSEVDELIYHQGQLMSVIWEQREGKVDEDGEPLEPAYVLRTEDGSHEQESGITDTEDVSYVSSPYLPQSLRGQGPPTTDNSNRAHESAAGESGIKDELDENIILRHVYVLVGEWIPFGANQIVALNEKLGSADRCQGGMFTGQVDKDSSSSNFQVDPGLTKVSILDFDDTKFINFEAEINFPEDEGIIQVENFGMHYGVDGKVVYGMYIEAIQDRKGDDICIDMLSRLLVDVHLDSSKITESLVSPYQTTLVETAFLGDAPARDKFNMLISEGIEPKLEASRYLDKEDNENELKQVLGDTTAAYNLTPDDVLIIGKNGMLISGPNSRNHEVLLVQYMALHGRNMFLKTFFTRTFILGDELRRVRGMIEEFQKDPNTVTKVRDRLSTAARDVIIMTETLGYMEDSLILVEIEPAPTDLAGKELHRILNCAHLSHNLKKRVRDLQKNIAGAENELGSLTRMTDAINTKQLEDVYKSVEKNTKSLVDACAAKERASASLEIMQVVFAASMAFDLVDLFTGLGLNTDLAPWQVAIEENLIHPPGVWFLFNMTLCFIMCYSLKILMGRLGAAAANFLTFSIVFNAKIDLGALKEYLDEKELEVSDGQIADGTVNKSAIWEEDDTEVWGGAAPKMEIAYDASNGWLIAATFCLDKKDNPNSEEQIKQMFVDQMVQAGVMAPPGAEKD